MGVALGHHLSWCGVIRHRALRVLAERLGGHIRLSLVIGGRPLSQRRSAGRRRLSAIPLHLLDGCQGGVLAPRPFIAKQGLLGGGHPMTCRGSHRGERLGVRCILPTSQRGQCGHKCVSLPLGLCGAARGSAAQ